MKHVNQTLLFFVAVMAFLLGGMNGAKRSEGRMKESCNTPHLVEFDLRGDGSFYLECKRKG